MQIKIMHGGVLRTFQRVVSDPDFSLFIKEGHSRIYTLLYAQLPRCCSHQEPTYSLLSALRSKERTLGTRLPSCLQFKPAARLGKQCRLQQTLPRLNSFTFSVKLSRCKASLCTHCFRYFSSFHFFTHRYVYLGNHFRARQDRSTGNRTLHQETSTNVWSALIALRDKSLLSRAAVLFHTKLQLTV